MNLIYIGIGGFLGAISRYLVSKYVNTAFPFSNMPYGTLMVNLIGAFVLSFLMSLSIYRLELPKNFMLFFTTGFIGSFTTFSTFMYETIVLSEEGFNVYSLLYLSISVFLGLLFAFLGYALGRLGT
ncbi:chromosome condensation protein CrcB [Marinitoga sp. 1135]|uniref:Fluoride-specific ion channel FluC n=1 Tax=Marinitoga piezophila (strain DSM 14283 / JCM 11233 / KA3) TaxID=443254 RepID=H2J7L4_MARPK|nr:MULTISPECIES: fluoride efflux transporter CrcB [Marinitoga]AEX85355.1 crcB protein [Marinitoga piezophila KA3]APT75833.1 chromosome condensation protein CrcB [Marinitoga sp. 1137]NUU95631.1 chromosome condensation protein CrcB [Marinitoga sp. 1135]NUU97490.1 chromosome condensation protein CrcB [Marinitoga sp. 1138]